VAARCCAISIACSMEETGLPVVVAEDPLTCVARGGGRALEMIDEAHAVMGQVTAVTPLSSTVVLITDSSHALPVQVLRNGLRTIALGSGRVDELRLPYLPTDSDIVEGDLLVTSGLGGKFPPGYPVATVARIDRSPDAPFAEVLARPRAHLDRSREILLVWTVPSTLPAHTPGADPALIPSPDQPVAGADSVEAAAVPADGDRTPTAAGDNGATDTAEPAR
jgi:rod shape-determining protein MreC